MKTLQLLLLPLLLLTITACEDEVLAGLDETENNILEEGGPDLFSLVSVSAPSPRGFDTRAVRVTIDADRSSLSDLQLDRIIGVKVNLGPEIEFDRLSFVVEYAVGVQQICFNAAFLLDNGLTSRGNEICFMP
ncbi:hypothetical protein [Lewinella sp. 4G2]|uniref:hypothetical protein n=1 Tax=Lewinella sp. 4G2 TaxID=1803372 RepID=UPI0007B49381|nr:hypothetical protein [Lewinella sp. 4G2]OAV44692.1 hypothetical protein A3850_009400 [Lewinella sp. 4G2]